jgi:hypothetical protein
VLRDPRVLYFCLGRTTGRPTAPLEIIDYVLVHELAHAEHPNHGPRFWCLVEQYVPNYEAKNECLKVNGTRLGFTIPSLLQKTKGKLRQ